MTVTQRIPRAARRALIAALLKEAGAVTTDEVATNLGISWMTVRRDFEALERDGLASRTHGGALSPSPAAPEGPPPPTEEQRRVAEAAAALIGDGETVVLDASPCAFAVAQALLGRRLTVITNSLPVMDAIARGGEATRLIGLCGRLDPGGAFTGARVLAAAREHFADRLLLGADALTPGGRLLGDDAAGAAVKRALVAQSDQVVLLVTGRLRITTAGALVARAGEVSCTLAAGNADLGPLRDAGVPVRSL
jgi:DeoR/GlpR family transcriptional regulator of sugar metabolism